MVRTGVIAPTSVIVLTRRTTVEDILRARKLGISDCIAKPLDGPVLVERVVAPSKRARQRSRLAQPVHHAERQRPPVAWSEDAVTPIHQQL